MFHNIWDNPSHWLIFFKIVNITSTSYRLNLHTAAISAVDHIGLTDWPVQEFTAFGWILFWIRGTFNNESTMTPGKCKTSLFFSWDSSWDFLGCFFRISGGFFYAVDSRKFRMINGHAGQEPLEDGGTNPIYFWPMFQGYFSGDIPPMSGWWQDIPEEETVQEAPVKAVQLFSIWLGLSWRARL